MKKTVFTLLFACLSGLIFALGLMLSGMTQPAKVIGFLNVSALSRGAQGVSWSAQPGWWDPSLAFVMGGALMVTLMAFALTPRWRKPWAAERFELPAQSAVDWPLIAGAVLFGVGWGLAGYCPGPALASLTQGAPVLIFTAAMLAGMWAAKLFRRHRSQ